MRIEQIRLRNFKMFQDVTVREIQPFTVLVGANGSGKSTFFDVFGFLRDCLKDNVRSALARRGGFREVVTRGHEAETILIELKFRMPLRIEERDSERTVTYLVEIASSNSEVRVAHEQHVTQGSEAGSLSDLSTSGTELAPPSIMSPN